MEVFVDGGVVVVVNMRVLAHRILRSQHILLNLGDQLCFAYLQHKGMLLNKHHDDTDNIIIDLKYLNE